MTLKEAVCDRRYNKAMLVLVFNIIALTLNGGIIGFYAQIILGKIFEPTTEGAKNVEIIQNIMSALGPFALILSIFATRGKSRKLVFIVYAFLIGLMNVGFAMSDMFHWAWSAGNFAIGITVI